MLKTTISVKALMCKNACLQCEKLSGFYLQDMLGRKAKEKSQTHECHCKNQHSEWTFTHFQLSPGVLHCHLKTPEHKLINFSSKIRPSSCCFCNCEWCPTENKPCPSLLSSKYHQLPQAHQGLPPSSSTVSSASFSDQLLPPESRPSFLNLGTTDISSQMTLFSGLSCVL